MRGGSWALHIWDECHGVVGVRGGFPEHLEGSCELKGAWEGEEKAGKKESMQAVVSPPQKGPEVEGVEGR